jgi:hypothetical protein
VSDQEPLGASPEASPAPVPSSPSKGFSGRTKALGAVAFFAAVVAIAANSVFNSHPQARNPGNITPILLAANCHLKVYPSQGRTHVAKLAPGFTYNSDPASSGPHFSSPANWGTYSTPVSQLVAVHNLEHGGIAAEYGSGVPANYWGNLINEIKKDPNGMILFPYPKLKKTLAFVAWRHVAICNPKNQDNIVKAFDAFRDAYRYRGPEHLPTYAMQPSPK